MGGGGLEGWIPALRGISEPGEGEKMNKNVDEGKKKDGLFSSFAPNVPPSSCLTGK